MPFSFGESINRISDAVLNAPIINMVTANPLWMAIVMTLIIVLIFVFVWRDVETEESMFLLAGRSAFWVFLLLAGALFLHNKVLTRDVGAEKSSRVFDGVYGAGSAAGYTMSSEPRVPMSADGARAHQTVPTVPAPSRPHPPAYVSATGPISTLGQLA